MLVLLGVRSPEKFVAAEGEDKKDRGLSQEPEERSDRLSMRSVCGKISALSVRWSSRGRTEDVERRPRGLLQLRRPVGSTKLNDGLLHLWSSNETWRDVIGDGGRGGAKWGFEDVLLAAPMTGDAKMERG